MSRTPKDGPGYPTVPLLVWSQYVYKFHMGKYHSAATVACNAKAVKYLGGVFAFVHTPLVVFPAAGNNFPTSETPNWNHCAYLYDF